MAGYKGHKQSTLLPVHLPAPKHELAGIDAALVFQHELLVDGCWRIKRDAVFRDEHEALVQGVLQGCSEQPPAGFSQ